jgi:hypothetical protein
MKSYDNITRSYLVSAGLTPIYRRDEVGEFRLSFVKKHIADKLVAKGRARTSKE